MMVVVPSPLPDAILSMAQKMAVGSGLGKLMVSNTLTVYQRAYRVVIKGMCICM